MKIIPKSPRNELLGWSSGGLRIRLQAPRDGQQLASRLQRFLAAFLEIPPANVEIVSGFGKLAVAVEISGLPQEKLARKLGIPAEGGGRVLSLPAVAPSA